MAILLLSRVTSAEKVNFPMDHSGKYIYSTHILIVIVIIEFTRSDIDILLLDIS